jgi:DNA polymerase III epsilon subunit-like protein
MAQITCCVFDLETSHLNADFGVVLCGVIKPDGQQPKVFRGDKLHAADWKRGKRSDDRNTVSEIVKELVKYDIWIAHNGVRFDLPFLRTRLAKWGLPPLRSNKILDPVLLARNTLRMSYNSLERIADFLGVNSKTPVTGDTWVRAYLDGDRDAMESVVDHCVRDVETLEKIVEALKAYSTQLTSWGSGR